MEAAPVVLFGTLLGAVRNQSIIPFTEDADVGYERLPRERLERDLRKRLWLRGYHVFKHGLWRVCVAPTHPLAGRLFSPARGLARNFAVPYLDLYEMVERKVSSGETAEWLIDGIEDDRPVPAVKFRPYTRVTINGDLFETVADPIDFLFHEYGGDFMEPQPRRTARPFRFFEDMTESSHRSHDENEGAR
ncbi:hypothetical protein PINS_up020354 [Pythium insidiosum]|nr:hypothetical protein PINS_up020354 [Pythium insidiosum]